jgi:hypothetical protein
VHGGCEKPRVKCGDCPNQAFIRVSDQAVLDHLQGRHVVGVYPMLQDGLRLSPNPTGLLPGPHGFACEKSLVWPGRLTGYRLLSTASTNPLLAGEAR